MSDIPYDSSQQTEPGYECSLSPNDYDFVVLAPLTWTSLAPGPEPPSPGNEAPDLVPRLVPSFAPQEQIEGEGGEEGYQAWVTTHPVRAEYKPRGTDLTFHRAGTMICADGYERPVWRSGRDKRYCVGEFWIWDQRDGETQVGSGYEFGLMVNDQPETSVALVSSNPGGVSI